MKIVTYRVTLIEPVLVTSLEGDPNSAVAYDYLPGSVLRGALIGLAMRYEGLKQLETANEKLWYRFFKGSTRFLNGYLVIDGKRSLPAPRSWEQDKHAQSEDQRKISDRALKPMLTPEAQHEQNNDAKEPGKAKSLGGKFCVQIESTDTAYIVEAQHVINVHTERDRQRGRSLGGDRGTIYRYDALAVGQIFEAIILCDEDEDADYFEGLLGKNPEAALGGARSAGYGRIALSSAHKADAQREVGGNIPAVSNQLLLTLLSDVILRDANGQFAPDTKALRAAIAQRIGVKTTQLKVDRVFKSEGIVGGFNRKWGLPLPQVPTVNMGSVFVFTLNNLSHEQIQTLADNLGWLEWHGIGERRIEGFGRIAVNWQQRETLEARKWEPFAETPEEGVLSAESKLLWGMMRSHIQRQQTNQQQLEKANALHLRRLPPTSQINRLRQIITSELLKTEPSTAVISRFLEGIKGKKASQYFNDARVGNQPLTDWLQVQAEAQDSYAALRLVDAMLVRAAKLKKTRGKTGRGETWLIRFGMDSVRAKSTNGSSLKAISYLRHPPISAAAMKWDHSCH